MSKNFLSFRLRHVARSCAFVLAVLFVMNGTTSRAAVPSFVRGLVFDTSVCASNDSISLNAILQIIDPDMSGTDTFSVLRGPYIVTGTGSTGSLAATTMLSSGSGTLMPSGTYFKGYGAGAYGVRSFTIRVSDGSGVDTIQINVHLQRPLPPTVSSAFDQVHVGSQITLTGASFTTAFSQYGSYTTNWSVSPGTLASIVFSGPTATLTGTNVGNVVVSYTLENSCGPVSGTYPITVLTNVAPIITSISSTSSLIPGSVYTINGSGLNTTPGNYTVYFGAVRATGVSATSTSITATVPVGAANAPIYVLDNSTQLSSYIMALPKPVFDSTSFIPSTYTNIYAPATTRQLSAPSSGGYYSLEYADFDGDGKLDIVASGTTSDSVQILRNQSVTGVVDGNSFATAVGFRVASGAISVRVADLDGDGKLDIITASVGAAQVSVLRNTSTGAGSISFAPRFDLPCPGILPDEVSIADFNRDGRLDIAVIMTGVRDSATALGFTPNTDQKSGRLVIMKNKYNYSPSIVMSSSSFDSITIYRYDTTSAPISLAAGDLNGDGSPDIVVSDHHKRQLNVFKNTTSAPGAPITFAAPLMKSTAAGNGTRAATFTPPSGLTTDYDYTIKLTGYPEQVKIGDLDNDGKVDIAVAVTDSDLLQYNKYNKVVLFHNSSIGTNLNFDNQDTTLNTLGITPAALTIADISGDGLMDIINTNSVTNNVSIFKNIGAVNAYAFAPAITRAIGGGFAGPVCVAVGDIDGNNIPEIAVVSRAASRLHLLRLYPRPDTFAIVADSVMCNLSSQFVHTHRGNAAGVTSYWTITGGHINLIGAADTSVTLSAVSPGYDTLSYYIVQLHDTNVIRRIIRVSTSTAPPHSVIAGPNSVCVGSNVTLSLSTGVGGGTWVSLYPAIATVSASGVVHGVSVGSDTIRYVVTTSCGNDTAYYAVAVTTLASAPVINGATRVCVAGTITLSVTAPPVGNTIAWRSTNPAVSSVNGSGVVSGISAGQDTIFYTVTNGCNSDSSFILDTVTAVPTNGTITGTTPMCVTGSQTFTDNASLTNVTSTSWSSSAPGIATINPTTGLASGVGATGGVATISYTINGCTTLYDTFRLVVEPVLTAPNISGPTRICIVTPQTLNVTPLGTGTATWRSATPAIATVNNAGLVSGVTPGEVVIRYVVSNSCRADSSSYIDTIGNTPTGGVINGANSMCNGSIQTLTNTTSTSIFYATWSSASSGVASVSSSTNTTATIAAVGTGTGAIITQSLVGCSAAPLIRTFSIDVNAAPSAGTISGPTRQCIGAGSSITLTHTGTVNGLWTRFSPATTNLTGANPATVNVTGLAAGVDTIYYTVTAAGCPDGVVKHIDTVQPNVVVGPVTYATASDTLICIGQTVVYSDTSTMGSWSSADVTIATVSPTTGAITGVASGTTAISYTVNAGCGAPIASTRNITVRLAPQPGVITGTSPLCSPNSATFTSNGDAGGTWRSTDESIAVVGANTGVVTGMTTTPAPGGNPSSFVTIRYIVTTSCGSDSSSTVVNIRTRPNPSPITTTGGGNPAALDSLCIGSTLNQTATPNTSTAPAAGLTTTWSFSNANATITGTGTVPTTITGAVAGLDTLTYTVSNGCGLPATSRRVIKIKAQDLAGTIVAPTTVCYYPGIPNIQLYDTLANGDTVYDGTWSVTAGFSVFVFSGTGEASFPGNFGTSTIRVVRPSFCNAAGVSTTTNITVIQSSNGGVITGSTAGGNICVGTYDTLTNDNFPFGDYWTTGDATIATVDANGIVTGTGAGSVSIYYVDTSICGTDSSNAFTVNVGGLSPTGFIFGQDTSCLPGTVQLYDTVAIAAGGVWSVASGSSVTIDATGVVTALSAGSSVIAYTTSNGCGPNDTTFKFTVFDAPHLVSPATATSCDSVQFTYTPNSDSAGASFAWTRDPVTGLSNVAGVGTGGISEYLDNTGNSVVNAVYVYTSTLHGCSGSDSVTVAVSPTPFLTSPLFDTICSGAQFNYTVVTSATASTAWTRALVTNIAPATGAGTGNISETLTYSGPATSGATVIYVYSVNYPGCPAHTENVTLSVNPTPAAPQITTHSPSDVCTMTMDQNFGSATPPPAGVTYSWTATGAQVWATGSTRQYSLVNFTEPGNAIVYLLASIPGLNCPAKDSFPVSVGSAISDRPEVIYFNGDFVCLAADQDTYQWGYDNRSTLDSELFTGETNQNYRATTPDFTGKYYFVITTHNGCMQKSYFNAPTGVTNVTGSMGDMKIFPNPADQFVNVEINNTPGGKYKVEVVNLLGQSLNAQDLVNNKATVSVADLASGVYFINCYRDGVKFASAKFVKN